MKVLVTGASGFLGRHVVQAALKRGHSVRALVRPAARVEGLGWPASVEIARADLRAPGDLGPVLEGIDVLVHLAAGVTGGEDAQFAASVVGTERLLTALARSKVKRVVLASSFSVYDWNAVQGGILDENTPEVAEPRLYQRDGYAIAKLWQEQIVRRAADQQKFELVVLRPGFIWGRDHAYLACLGQAIGPLHVTIGPRTRLPLTHVENCADVFALCVDHPAAKGQIFNIVDSDDIRTSQYLSDFIKRSGTKWRSMPVPYLGFRALTEAAERTVKWIFDGKGKLPSLLVPIKFEARFKPVRFSNRKVRETLGWTPPLSYQESLDRTYDLPAS